MERIDLRSDTVTCPTPEMRKAMADVEVGDDVFGEYSTINRLQEIAAEKTGKEAGLFVASGTMGNLTAVLTHCNRGDEVILGNLCHTYVYEAGGISALGGVHPYAVMNQPDGTLLLQDVKNAIRKDDVHFPLTRLVMLENTHNRCGGVTSLRNIRRTLPILPTRMDCKFTWMEPDYLTQPQHWEYVPIHYQARWIVSHFV